MHEEPRFCLLPETSPADSGSASWADVLASSGSASWADALASWADDLTLRIQAQMAVSVDLGSLKGDIDVSIGTNTNVYVDSYMAVSVN